MTDRTVGPDARPGHGELRARARRGMVVGLLVLAMAAAPSLAGANGKARETSREGGLGAAAALSTLVYGPTKLIYATGGLIVGSLAWVFTAGDSQVASHVFTRSLRGTYVITPQILMGEEPLEFIGREAGAAETSAPTAAVASAPPSYETTDYDSPSYDGSGW